MKRRTPPLMDVIWRSDTFIERDGIEIKENKHSNWDKYILAPLQYWVESPSSS